MALVRRIVLLSLFGLIAVGAFAAASIEAARSRNSFIDQRLWSSHPRVLTSTAMEGIGRSARAGHGIPPASRALLLRVARLDPLAPEPFLADGATAQTEGRAADAEELFEAALARDPRNGAARYFLAGRYFLTRRLDEGLSAMDGMARMVPGAGLQFVPTLVSFAKQPAALPVMRRFLRRSPSYASPVLEALSGDAANAELIVALAPPRKPGEPAPSWQGALVSRLIESGQAARAQTIWRSFSGVSPYGGIFNPTFISSSAPPPFNWTYDASGAGLITTGPQGGLKIIYYGRQEADLAVQVLALMPGIYSFASDVSSSPEGALNWKIDCQGDNRHLLVNDLDTAATFTVPASGCPTQRMHLVGTLIESQKKVELTVNAVRLQRRAGR